MSKVEVDVVRSAIVFASAGLDASMKRLVNDLGRELIAIPGTGARGQFEAYLKEQVGKETVEHEFRDAVIDLDPASRFTEMYLADRTKSSFQGSSDLKGRIRNALGIPRAKAPDADLEALDDFFEARNKISHEMDLENPKSSSRARVHRKVEDVVAMCDQAFATGSLLINGAAHACKQARK